MSQKILEIIRLSKTYRNRQVLRNLNFEVYAGEIFGFIGPNGAGKSTLIRIICGLTPPTSGDVLICGKSIQSEFEKAIANVGAVMENCELYSYMTGKQNLQYYAGLIKGVTKSDIDRVTNLVGLENRINDRVKTYSFGMRQRLSLAQALLNNPKLLILDEPTNGLDVNGIIELRQTLKILAAKQNMAIFVSSHILAEMEQICDTVAIFDHGNILELRTLAYLQNASGNSKHLQIKVDYPNYAGKILNLKFGVNVELAGNSVLVPYIPEFTQDYIQALRQRDVTIFGVDVISKNLEDIYLEILKARQSGSIK